MILEEAGVWECWEVGKGGGKVVVVMEGKRCEREVESPLRCPRGK